MAILKDKIAVVTGRNYTVKGVAIVLVRNADR